MKRSFALLMAALLLLPACTKEIRTETLKLEEEIPLHEGSSNALSLSLDIDFPVSGFSAQGLEAVRQAIRTYAISDNYADCNGPLSELGQIWRNTVAEDYLETNQSMLEEMEISEEDAPFLNWGYIKFASPAEVTEEYVKYARQLRDMVARGFSAAVYTQTTDVEIEVNGLMTYDRRVDKVDIPRIREINQQIIKTLQ